MSDSAEWLRNLARNYADGVAGMEPQDHRAWEIAAEIERLWELKTPASRELLNITKGCLDNAEAELRAEIERLRALSQNNTRSWDALVRERDELRADNERLKADMERSRRVYHETQWAQVKEVQADNERLKAALALAQSQNYCTLCGALNPRMDTLR